MVIFIWGFHKWRKLIPRGRDVLAKLRVSQSPTQPHRNSNTHRHKNNPTNVIIQQNSRKLLMLDILMSENYWAHKKWNKIASDIKLVFILQVSQIIKKFSLYFFFIHYFFLFCFWFVQQRICLHSSLYLTFGLLSEPEAMGPNPEILFVLEDIY